MRSYVVLAVAPLALSACSLVVGENDVYLFDAAATVDAGVDAGVLPDASSDAGADVGSDATLPPVDGGTDGETDAGSDAIATTDATLGDSSQTDSGALDAPVADGATADASILDGSPLDSSMQDAPATDASSDAFDAAESDAAHGDGSGFDAETIDGGHADAASPDANADAPPTTDAGIDALVDSGPDAHAVDAGIDAATCAETLCASQCVNLQTSATNCSACGHACGGSATCSGGLCEPLAVTTDGPIVGFAIDNGNMFLHVFNDGGSGGIDECSVNGCASFTPIVASATEENNYGALIAATGGVIADFSSGGQGQMSLCPETTGATRTRIGGTGASDPIGAGGYLGYESDDNSTAVYVYHAVDGGYSEAWEVGSSSLMGTPGASSPFAIDGVHFVWRQLSGGDAGIGMLACTTATGCTDKILVTATIPAKVNVFGNAIYYTNGATVTTSAIAANATATTLVTLAGSLTIAQTTVDTTGFYWIDSTGAIGMCPFSGCPAGGVPVTTATTKPASRFAVYDGYVYFVGTAASSSTVYKVVVP